jgi:hypothetical protein
MQEVRESLLQLGKIFVVVIKVIGIDVGDDGGHGRQLQERAIGLVGLGHEVVAGT